MSVVKKPNPASSFLESGKTRMRSGTLSTGITVKMDVFARHVADGVSLAEAYRRAFNTTNMKPKTIRDDASRLAQHSGVRAAIEAYRAEIESRNRISALKQEDRIWASLWALVEDDGVVPSVRVKALNLAAELCGMFNIVLDEQPLAATAIVAELDQRLKYLGC